MNKVLMTSLLTTACLFAGSVGHADTPLKLLPGTAVTLQGQNPYGAKIQALAYYTPSFNYDPSQSAKPCDFGDEDLANANDSDRPIMITAKQNADKTYTLILPTQGLRGHCAYGLSVINITAETSKIYEPLALKTENGVVYDKNLMGDSAPASYPSLTNLKSVLCQFSASVGPGTCSETAEYYEVSSSPQTYTLDFLNRN